MNLIIKREKNLISLKNLKFIKNNFYSIEKIKVLTFKKSKKNNDFIIFYDKKILIEGKQYDATNLSKYINEKSKKIHFQKLIKK